MINLNNKYIQGFIEKWSSQLFNIASVIYLNHILPVTEFGKFAILNSIFQVLIIFCELGLIQAYNQNKARSKDQLLLVSIIILVTSSLTSFIFLIVINKFESLQIYSDSSWVIPILLMLQLLYSVYTIRYYVHHEYDKLIKRTIIVSIVAFAATVIYGTKFQNFIAFFIYPIFFYGLFLIISFLKYSREKKIQLVKYTFSFKWMRELFNIRMNSHKLNLNFGLKSMFSNILDIGYSSLAYFLLNRKFGFLEVGALNRARYFPDILNSFYLSFFGRVLFTDISNFDQSNEDLRLHYGRSVRISYIFYSQVIVTIGVFYFLFSKIFIGKANQYEDFKLILVVFLLSTFLYILDAINLIFLRALGQINVLFKVEILKKIIFSTILLTIPFSSLLSITILLLGLLILSSFVSSILVYLNFGGLINRILLLDFSLFVIVFFISQLDIVLFIIAPIYLAYSIYNLSLFIQMKRYFQ